MIGFLKEEWISRAGCLIVVLGIASGVGGVIHERLLMNGLEMRRRIARAGIRRRFRGQPEEIERRIAESEQAFIARGESLTHELKLSIGLLEASLLLAGTLLWGFGDLSRLAWT